MLCAAADLESRADLTPRGSRDAPRTPPGLRDCARVILQFILLALLGLTLGYAAGKAAWLGLLVPVFFALISAFNDGVTGRLIVLFIIALVVMAAAIVVGLLIDRRTGESSESA